MLRLLPKLGGPYFDFLVIDAGQCRADGHLKKEYFHHPEALRVQDAIVSVFVQAFAQSHRHFNYYGDTEYTGDELRDLGRLLIQQIEAVSSCRTRVQFQAKLTELFKGYCDEDLGLWLPKWRRVRNELEAYGRQILRRVEQAEREQKGLLALGV